MGLDVLPSTQSRFSVYSMHDSAIDRDASDLEAYAKTGDEKHLAFLPKEEEPGGRVLFTCRPVSWEEYERILIEAKGDPNDAAVELFRVGIMAIDNWVFEEDGKPKQLNAVKKPRAGRSDRLVDSVFLRIPIRVARDIGTAIFNVSGLAEHLAEWMERMTRVLDEHRKNS